MSENYHQFCDTYLARHLLPNWQRPAFEKLNKSEGGKKFQLVTNYQPSGDQPHAIKELICGINKQEKNQVLLGVTGSGKTFTMANIIARTGKPALIMAHNKTLAAQLYLEFKQFFPHNAVEYFVSYYDYYQPEAYVPRTDTFIEKDSSVNEQIDRMRHSATRALLERDDVIIVSSVSCIYGIGSVETYLAMSCELKKGTLFNQRDLIKKFSELQYKRNDNQLERGVFRVRGDVIQIFPSHLEDRAWQISLFGDEIDNICEIDPLTGEVTNEYEFIKLYANSHYVTPRPTINQAIKRINKELEATLQMLSKDNMLLEQQRILQRTKFDLESLEVTGICKGIENYSRFLTGRVPGSPPPTLFEYLDPQALLFVDESHQSVPQIGGMFKGDMARKSTLAKFGFRLTSCMDNRPLKFEEWNSIRPQTIFVSATPGSFELELTSGKFTEQIIRPTGLIDPLTEIRPVSNKTTNQVDDVIDECKKVIKKNERILITTLTKKMSEDLTEYLTQQGIKCRYMHSDIDTLERIEIIRDLRLGTFDVLIGINLLREGLDIPECSLVAILDADKEGFLRSETSLVQTIGRAARHKNGRVILYADKITGSIKRALDETNRRRNIQITHNKKHNITPTSIKSNIAQSLYEKSPSTQAKKSYRGLSGDALKIHIKTLRKTMHQHAQNLEFEEAANIRDEINYLLQNDILVK